MTRDAASSPDLSPDVLADGDEDEGQAYGERVLTLEGEAAEGRVDKVLAGLLPEFSRARIQALIAEGRVSRDGVALTDELVLDLQAVDRGARQRPPARDRPPRRTAAPR